MSIPEFELLAEKFGLDEDIKTLQKMILELENEADCLFGMTGVFLLHFKRVE